MSDIIRQRILQAQSNNEREETFVLREVIQEIALLALWRAKFFQYAAFYGGTSLRILYGLDRFSEDLDFTLLEPDSKFEISRYGKAVELELKAFGFEARLERKKKQVHSSIDSAFVKTDSYISFIVAESKFRPQKGSLIKVKLEIDTGAVPGFSTEAKQFFWPQPFSVLTCDLPSLMAGKIHAAFCRGVRKNVKGRDWYDLLWYVARNVKPNWTYLENKMRDSGHWHDEFTPEQFCLWAKNAVTNLDIKAAKNDVRRFIRNPSQLDGWSHEAFSAAIDRMR